MADNRDEALRAAIDALRTLADDIARAGINGFGNRAAMVADSLALLTPRADAGVMVPREPTEAMLRAAKRFQCDHDTFDGWMEFCGRDVIGQYKTMLKAATPKEPT